MEEDDEPQAQANEQVPTSRICVKNLPKHVDAARLREHFGARGEVTDAKVQLEKATGRSRQMGFVGFKTVQQAAEALRFYNHTFLDTSRIEVEFARPYGSRDIPRPWSKYSEGSSRHEKKEPKPVKEEPKQLTVREAKKLARAKKLAKAAERSKNPEDEDPELQEFLSLMQPRSKQKAWADGAAPGAAGRRAAPGGAADGAEDGDAEARAAGGEASSSDDEDYQELPAAKGKGKGTKAAEAGGQGGKKAKGKGKGGAGGEDDFDFMDDTAEEGEGGEEEGDDGEEEPAAEEKDLGVSDMDYIRQRTRTNWSDSESEGDEEEEEEEEEGEDDEEDGEEDDEAAAGEDEGEEEEGAADELDGDAEGGGDGDGGRGGAATEGEAAGALPDVRETRRIFCRNLPFTATEDELREFFEPHGELKAVHVVLDRATKQSKGLAFVEFAEGDDAANALSALDMQFFQGRLLHLLPAKAPPQVATVEEVAGSEGFKALKEAKLKAGAGDRKIWSSLFVRADTVAEAIAAKFGVSKSDVMDPGSSDVAARLALGEAQVISDTKRELAKGGVDVAALEAAAARTGAAGPRSNSVILLKNLPYSASEDDLRPLVERFGALGRFILPSSRALAVVEFLEPADARRAFAGMAYKRFQSVPIYVEWAPAELLRGPAPAAAQKKAPAGKKAKATAEDLVGGEEEHQAAEDEGEDGRILYVKNLAFGTTDAGLRKHFEAAAKGSVRSATVSKKPGKTPGAAPLSAGFGFVEFATAKAAAAAMAKLQGVALDGHALKLAVSRGGGAGARRGGAGGGDGDEPGRGNRRKGLSDTKIIVRNVAFEATKKDLKTLFAPFGQIKSLRQPRKFDGQHRGFAFVEMTTKAEAKAAFEALSQTHLYGRHLVLEWAKEGEGIEEIRAKTAAHYAAAEAAASMGSKSAAKRKRQQDADDDYE